MGRCNLLLTVVAVLLCGAPSRGQNRCQVFPPGGYVGVFTDSLAQDSVITLELHPSGWAGSFHILAVLNGAVAHGITAAEFRVHLPLAIENALFILTNWSPDITVRIGQPFAIGTGSGGVVVAWPQCQQGQVNANGKVVVQIARVDVFSFVAFDTPVFVKMMSTPDFRAPCPNFRKCDTPVFTPAPMVLRGMDTAGEDYAFSGRLLCGGVVELEVSGWSRIKALYR